MIARKERFTADPPPEWTPQWVEAVMTGALLVVRSTTLTRRDYPRFVPGAWVQMVMEAWNEAYGRHDERPVRVRPDSFQIQAAEYVLPWFFWVPPRDRRVMVMRMMGFRWGRIAEVDGRNRDWLSRGVTANAYARIAHELASGDDRAEPKHFANLAKFAISAR